MKKTLAAIFLSALLTLGAPAVLLAESALPQQTKKVRKKVPKQTRKYIRGPRGGCYYINRNGNKTYVDRSMCR